VDETNGLACCWIYISDAIMFAVLGPERGEGGFCLFWDGMGWDGIACLDALRTYREKRPWCVNALHAQDISCRLAASFRFNMLLKLPRSRMVKGVGMQRQGQGTDAFVLEA
jgi:hypothetical protein